MKSPHRGKLWLILALLLIPQAITIVLSIPAQKPWALVLPALITYAVLPLIAAILLCTSEKRDLEAFGTSVLVWLVFMVLSMTVSIVLFFAFLALANSPSLL